MKFSLVVLLFVLVIGSYNNYQAFRNAGNWPRRVPGSLSVLENPVHVSGVKSVRNTIPLSAGETKYEIYSSETGKTPKGVLFCIHGLSTPSNVVWNSFAVSAALENYVVITFDLYGRGGSEAPYEPQTPSLFSSQAVELLFLLQNSGDIPKNLPITVIGLSMGGAIATKFAVTFHSVVDNLILLAPAGLGAPIPWFHPILDLPIVGEILIKLVGPNTIQSHIDQVYKDQDNLQWEDEGGVSKFYQRVIKALSNQFEHHSGFAVSLLGTLRDFPLTDMEFEYQKLPESLPIDIIWGDKDSVCPKPSNEKLNSLIPHANIHVLPGAEHDFVSSHVKTITDIILHKILSSEEK